MNGGITAERTSGSIARRSRVELGLLPHHDHRRARRLNDAPTPHAFHPDHIETRRPVADRHLNRVSIAYPGVAGDKLPVPPKYVYCRDGCRQRLVETHINRSRR